ncbi:hypothetical protein HYU21_02265, partial [Candidatus Woesearchaeota archaeon]|nr:hypothetical protein [Candidatus Woesearchaeota archaeon]
HVLEKLVDFGAYVGLVEDDPREFAYNRYFCSSRAGDNLFAAFMVYEPRFTGFVDDPCAETEECEATEFNTSCQGNEIHETDNCGNNTLIQNCTTTAQICQDAACITEEPECTLEAEVRCFDGNARWVDSCGTWGDIADYCTTAEHCEDDIGCVPNEIEEICEPIAGCEEAGCVLYDDFSSGTLGECRWRIDGEYDIHGGVLYLNEEAHLSSSWNAPEEACHLDYVEYRTRSSPSNGRFLGLIKKSYGLDYLIYRGVEHPNQLGFACDPGDAEDIQYVDGFNPGSWNNIKVQYADGNMNLYLNDGLIGSTRCTSDLSDDSYIFDLDLRDGLEVEIDEAKIVCKE